MNETLINHTYQTVEYLKTRPSFLALLDASNKLESPYLKPLIVTYQNSKNAYLEAKKYQSYHPEFKTLQMAFQKAKNDLYSHKDMKTYFVAYKNFQNELDLWVHEIALAISPKIKHPNLPTVL